MMKPQNSLSLKFKLAQAMRVAARNIEVAAQRRIAANHAKNIPMLTPEKCKRGWGKLASQGRALMARLETIPPDERAEVAAILRQCANDVQHGSTLVSETSISDVRREKRRA